MKITKFEDLPIWKLSLHVTKEIYDLTAKPIFNKDYYLKDQIRRAVVSISSNIVEGFEKSNNNEFMRFLRIAKGSTGEVRNQLYICLTINYITQADFKELNNKFEELAHQIGGLIYYLSQKKLNKEFINRR